MPTPIDLTTPDGTCRTELFEPPGSGPWPAVIFFVDAAGIRPAMRGTAERIAAQGYLVFMPDLFHRSPPLQDFLGEEPKLAMIGKVFGDPALRSKFMATYYLPALDYLNLGKTIGTLLDHISHRSDFKGRVGTTGYCMGGNASFRAGILFGDRIAATAAFHPGGLVTDGADSPHLRAGSIKSRVYLGPAVGDLPPEPERQLREALSGVRFEIEQYEARHGYAVDDAGSYDPAAARKHDQVLERLFRETLEV